MGFDARIKPARQSTHRKKGVLFIFCAILLLGLAIYQASTFFEVKTLLDKPAKEVVVKTLPLPDADPLSKKNSA